MALQGHVALENVSFAYPSRSDVQVLKDFSLVVRPNATVALVGQRCVHVRVWVGSWVDTCGYRESKAQIHRPKESC